MVSANYDQEFMESHTYQEELQRLNGAAHTTAGFHLTDLGNGERLVARYGQNLRYCNPWRKWLTWDGTRWQLDNSQQVKQWARDTVRAIYAEPSEAESKKERYALAAHAMKSEQEARLNAMTNLAQMDVPILPEQFDADPWLLNVANGTLDLRTGTLRPHNSADYITKCIPIAYNADAACPLWEQFLASIMAGNDDVIDFLWKATGYSLTGDVREDCLFLLYGTGANGKSTFLTILRALLADYGKQAAFSTFLHKDNDPVRNDIADLQGARLVVASEVDEGKRLSTSVVKHLTGQDKVKARFLFAENFEYAPQFKLWLATNYKPVIRGTDHAIWRRIRLIPFTQKFVDAEEDGAPGVFVKDDTIRDKLLAELPGILAWAVRGCLAWQEEKLPMPETVKIATEGYRNEMDVVGAFMEECCEVEERANVLTASLFDAYVAWCKRSGEEPSSKKAFGIRMEERGFTPGKGTAGIRIWKGLRLAPTE
jgi:putative DNA primase/helicase